MQYVHITDEAADRAAHLILASMLQHGGEWLVNPVEEEGYVMARVGTPFADRLQRSGATFVGPVDARWDAAFIEADLIEAKHGENGATKRKIRAAAKRIYRGRKIKRTRRTILSFVLQALTDKPLTADAVAEHVGISEQAAKNAIRRLKRSGRIRIGGTGSSNRRVLYEAAAGAQRNLTS